eukprot:8536799-Prorocentrum_lima.AAC.1
MQGCGSHAPPFATLLHGSPYSTFIPSTPHMQCTQPMQLRQVQAHPPDPSGDPERVALETAAHCCGRT